MIKKLLFLAAGAVFSLNASAGYVQYDLHMSSQLGSGNHGLSGILVQHDDDSSIAFFSLRLDDPSPQVSGSARDAYLGRGFGQGFHPFNDEGSVLVTSESTYFRNNGPTNFTIEDSHGGDHITDLSVSFSRTTGGAFEYTASYRSNLYYNLPPVIFSGMVTGLATKGTVDPLLAMDLDMWGGYDRAVPRIIPTYIGPNNVPEPASLALFAVGALGAAGAARRRKTAG
jgi:hypothetical protein